MKQNELKKTEIVGGWTASWQQGRTLQTDFRNHVAMLTCSYKDVWAEKQKVFEQTVSDVCETCKCTLQPTCLVQSEFEEVHVLDGKASDLERHILKQNIDRIWMCNTQNGVLCVFLYFVFLFVS